MIRAHGHQGTDVGDIGLGTAPDQDIADYARHHQLGLITGDQDFGNVLAFPPADYFGLVIIRPDEVRIRYNAFYPFKASGSSLH